MTHARSKASRDAGQLASGTIASLIHRNRYEIIDRARDALVAFTDRMDAAAGPAVFACWQDAWEAFRQTDAVYDLMLADDLPTRGHGTR